MHSASHLPGKPPCHPAWSLHHPLLPPSQDGKIILKGPTPANLTFVPYNQSTGCAPLTAAVDGLSPTPSSAAPSPSPSPWSSPGASGGGRPAGSPGKPSGASGPKQGGGQPAKGPSKTPYRARGRTPGRAQLIIRGQ